MSETTPASTKANLKASGLSAEGQIFILLKEEILAGRWNVGSAIPSLRDLAGRFGVSRVPVHRAIIKLEEVGLVKRVHGSGVHVLRNQPTAGERKLPQVQTFDVLRKPAALLETDPGPPRHMVVSAEHSMLWHLTRSRAVRLRRIPVVDQNDMLRVLEDMDTTNVDVFVFVVPEILPARHLGVLRQFVRDGGSVVYRSTWMDIPEFDAVKMDFESGQFQLTEHLFAQGIRNPVCCKMGKEPPFDLQKRSGFRRACQDMGWDDARIERSMLTPPESGETRAEELRNTIQWLKEKVFPLKADAIMAVNDPQAAIVRLALARLGKGDLMVTGYDSDWNEVDWKKFLTGLGDAEVAEVAAMVPPVSVDAGHWDTGEALARLALERATKKLPQGSQIRILPQKLVLPETQK